MEKPFCLFNLNVCLFVFSGVKFRIFYSLLWMYWWWSGSRLWRICPCHTWNLFTVSIYFTLTNMGAIGCQLYCFLGMLMHGGLYWWRTNSFPFFVRQKLKEILIWYSRIILPASKDRLISKIWKVWFKNCHAHLDFEL